MSFYVVSYDLVKEHSGKDYKPLWDALGKLDSCKAQQSTYLVASTMTKLALFNHLTRLIDEDDRLLVVPFSERPKFNKGFTGINSWVAKHFPTK
jgi:hypothetical protein